MSHPNRNIQSTLASIKWIAAIPNRPWSNCPSPGMKKLAKAAITLPVDPLPPALIIFTSDLVGDFYLQYVMNWMNVLFLLAGRGGLLQNEPTFAAVVADNVFFDGADLRSFGAILFSQFF